ncbi:zinc finger, CCHC-type containing protein [Tanacetum coccineum]
MAEEDALLAFQHECGMFNPSMGMCWSFYLDIYQNVESSKELWDSLEAKYIVEDLSSKTFLISNFTNYKMTDSRPVMEQYNELLGRKAHLLEDKEILRRSGQDFNSIRNLISRGHTECGDGGNGYSLKDKNKAKTDKTEHGNGMSVKNRSRRHVYDQHSYCFNVEHDPKTFDEAMNSYDVAFWKEAINDEIDSIMGNNTRVLADLPQGIDHFDTYAPVACISTIRLLIALASIHNLIIHQMDVKTTFLNGELDEEVYMNQPRGCIMPGNENKVCKLINKFDKSGKGVIICLYVDDMLIFGTDQVQVDLTKKLLSSRFSMKDIGEVDVVLGIRIKHESNGIAISQSHYIEKVPKKFNYFNCTLVSTPMDISEKLMPNNGQAVSQLEYSRIIGCLMYVMTCTRPDIAFAMGKLSRDEPREGSYVLDDFSDEELCFQLRVKLILTILAKSRIDDDGVLDVLSLVSRKFHIMLRFDDEIKKFGFTQNLDEAYLGEATYIHRVKIIRDRSKGLIALSQSAYFDDILKKFKMENSKHGNVPMQEKPNLSKSQGAKTLVEVKRMQRVPYALAYRNTKDMVLVYRGNLRNELKVTCYTNVGFKTDKDDTKSQSRYVFVLNGGVVDWKSAKQSTIEMSSTYSEYIAASKALMEAV